MKWTSLTLRFLGFAAVATFAAGGGYLAGHFEGRIDGAMSEREASMNALTAQCVRDGGFSWRGFDYHCALTPESQRYLKEQTDPPV